MASFGVEVSRKRVWGVVKTGTLTVFGCGIISFWWMSHRLSDELIDNQKALERASIALADMKRRLIHRPEGCH